MQRYNFILECQTNYEIFYVFSSIFELINRYFTDYAAMKNILYNNKVYNWFWVDDYLKGMKKARIGVVKIVCIYTISMRKKEKNSKKE